MIRARILVLILTIFLAQVVVAFAAVPKDLEANKGTKGDSNSRGEIVGQLPARVTGAWRVLPEQNRNTGLKDEMWIGQVIHVKVENLETFLSEVCKEGYKKDNNCKEKDISLFLNGMELKGIRPWNQYIDKGNKNSGLDFILSRRESLPTFSNDPRQKSVWATLFGFQDHLTLKPRLVDVSIGPEGGYPLTTEAKMKLVRIHFDVWAFFYTLVIVFMCWAYWKAGKKGAFSDRGQRGSGNVDTALSLARVQMGFWFFLVVAAFLFIWMVIGELPGIPASVLGLIGIASGTALGASVIDNNKRAKASKVVDENEAIIKEYNELKNQVDLKETHSKDLNGEIKKLNDNLAAEPKLQEEINKKSQEQVSIAREIEDISSKLKGLEKKQEESKNIAKVAKRNEGAVPTQGLLEDLLNDENGISFHRLQMVIWTLVLGLVFIQQVVNNLSLPDFDATFLALMGISSGTYLGFKLPEQQPASSVTQ